MPSKTKTQAFNELAQAAIRATGGTDPQRAVAAYLDDPAHRDESRRLYAEYTAAQPDPVTPTTPATPSALAPKRQSEVLYDLIRGEAANLRRSRPDLSEAAAVAEVCSREPALYQKYSDALRAGR